MEYVKLELTITCPRCGRQKQEKMFTDACRFFMHAKVVKRY